MLANIVFDTIKAKTIHTNNEVKAILFFFKKRKKTRSTMTKINNRRAKYLLLDEMTNQIQTAEVIASKTLNKTK